MSLPKVIKFPPILKELRIHLCQKSSSSKGVRDFIEKNYVNLKKANPSSSILIRECSGVTPKVWARFELGEETHVNLQDLGMEQVASSISNLVNKK